MTTVGIVHYTPPGVIGGVEHILHEHARLLRARGFRVEFVAGRPGDGDFPVHVIPELNVAAPESVAVEAELARGEVTPRFAALRQEIERQLRPVVSGMDSLIVHNAFTLHFNLPLTAVMWQLAAERPPGATVAWSHDLAWTNPLYLPAMHPGYPWDLLRQPAAHTTYVTISHERRRELLALWGGERAPVDVIPNGIDVGRFLRLSPETLALAGRYDLFAQDAVLLLPVRITRRKSIEVGIRVVRALRDRGLRVRFLVTGPAASHHPRRSQDYLAELKAARAELHVEDDVIFVADDLGRNLPYGIVSELFALADALFFPSAQEGFGLPILEAGLSGLPAVVADIPIFREVGGDTVFYFNPADPPDRIATAVVEALDAPVSRLRRRVLQHYRWEVIVDRQIVPLIEAGVRAVQQKDVVL